MFASAAATILAASSLAAAAKASFPEGVIATGTQGTTNPPTATMPSAQINQGSMARLLSLNSIDDFCLFAPPEPGSEIADTEGEEVAWCTQPRNNARVIPDGTITGVTFLKNDFYVQIMGTGDFTKLNIKPGDEGGELDPHGATGAGNPVGGNVTTTVADGTDEPIAEWMQYISDSEFCIRACFNANATYSSAFMCWHELDVMGCDFVMPGTYNPPGTFESCEADVAYPPGWYPTATQGTTTLFSTFAQYWSGSFTGADGLLTTTTIGDTVTPDAPYTIPSSSNCVTQATISNGLPAASVAAGASGAVPAGYSSSAGGAGILPTGPQQTSTVSSTTNTNTGITTSTTKTAQVVNTAAPTNNNNNAETSTTTTDGGNATGSSAARRAVSLGSGGEFVAIALVSILSGVTAVALLH